MYLTRHITLFRLPIRMQVKNTEMNSIVFKLNIWKIKPYFNIMIP